MVRVIARWGFAPKTLSALNYSFGKFGKTNEEFKPVISTNLMPTKNTKMVQAMYGARVMFAGDKYSNKQSGLVLKV